mgnify:FL=1
MKKNYNFKFILKILFVALLPCWPLSAQQIEIITAAVPGVNGIHHDANGNLWITQVGSGKDDGTLSIITPNKTIHPVIHGLPSYFDSLENETQGAWKAYLNGKKLNVIVGGRIHQGTGSLITFDLSNWQIGDSSIDFSKAEKIIHISDTLISRGFKESDPYRVVWETNGDAIVADAAANAIIKINGKTDQVTVLHQFEPIKNIYTPFPPYIDYVPTGIVKNPNGGYYVCNLTGFPFIPGLSSIVKLDESGNVTPFANDLTLLSDLDIDAEGNVYALQLGQFDTTFNPIPFASKITKITPSGAPSNYVEKFTPILSSGIALDHKGGVYVNDFALGQIKHITFTTNTKIVDKNNTVNMEVYPNPMNSSIQVHFEVFDNDPVNISLVNLTGSRVYSQLIEKTKKGKQILSIPVDQLVSGTYIIQLKTNSSVQSVKLIKN